MDKRGLVAGIILGIIVIAVIAVTGIYKNFYDPRQLAPTRISVLARPQSLCDPECGGCTRCAQICRPSVDGDSTGPGCPQGQTIGYGCVPKEERDFSGDGCSDSTETGAGLNRACCGTQCYNQLPNNACCNTQVYDANTNWCCGGTTIIPDGQCCGNAQIGETPMEQGIGCSQCEFCSEGECYLCEQTCTQQEGVTGCCALPNICSNGAGFVCCPEGYSCENSGPGTPFCYPTP